MPTTSRRTLVAYKLACHRLRKPDILIPLDEVCAAGFLGAFLDFCDSFEGSFSYGDSGKYCFIDGVDIHDEGILLRIKSGSDGEGISILDPEKATIIGRYGSDKAPMVDSRVYLRKAAGDFAVLFVEHVKGSAGDTFLKTPMKDWFKKTYQGYLMDWEPIAEEESLDALNSIEDFEVRKYLRSSDFADSLVTGARYISCRLAHKPRHPFPVAMLREALADLNKAKTLFGLFANDDHEDRVEVYVKANSKSGRTVRFDISKSMDWKINEILNDRGEPVLSDGEFKKRCDWKGSLIERRLGRG